MNISLVKTNSTRFFQSKNFRNKNFDFYIFLGKNPILGNKIDLLLGDKIDKINFLKEFIKIQYENRDNYIDYIDKSEKSDFGNEWWNTRISGKNPWISATYFRFCQILLLKNILQKNKNKDVNILIVFEEFCVFKSAQDLIKNHFTCKIENLYVKQNLRSNLILKGIIRRASVIPYYLIQAIRLKLIFSDFSNKIFLDNKVFVFSFLDDRCFVNNNFEDPFLAKFLKKINITSKISYIPVINNISSKKLLIFKNWLKKNQNSVTFLPYYFSLNGLFSEILNSRLLYNSKNKFLSDVNLSFLINRERLEEWSEFSLQNFLIRKVSNNIKSTSNKKLIIYPFENQLWERNMLSVFQNDNQIIIYGVQNAPAPKLSIRYFVSKSLVKHLPLPNLIFVTGNISYENLFPFYGNNILKKISSSRKIVNNIKKSSSESVSTNIMVACSISVPESIQLINFVFNSLNNVNNYKITIVPHPLSKFNYSKYLKTINVSHNFYLSKDYSFTLNNSKYILFDSSTAGIEGLLNGLVPIRISNEYMLSINPIEFDNKYTKHAYKYQDLITILNSNQKTDNDGYKIALKYYKTDDSKVIKDVVNQLEFLL